MSKLKMNYINLFSFRKELEFNSNPDDNFVAIMFVAEPKPLSFAFENEEVENDLKKLIIDNSMLVAFIEDNEFKLNLTTNKNISDFELKITEYALVTKSSEIHYIENFDEFKNLLASDLFFMEGEEIRTPDEKILIFGEEEANYEKH